MPAFGAFVISAGGKEVGEAGKQIEEKIRDVAYAGGLRIMGPNCFGIIRPDGNLYASFALVISPYPAEHEIHGR